MTKPIPHHVFAADEELRAARRFKIALPVVVNTAINDQKGWIVDVSKQGLKIQGLRVPRRARVCVHYRRQFAEGSVRWVKPGGIVGIVLDVPLKEGPLASIWKRFQDNVDAFGKHKRQPRPVFGRKKDKREG